MATISGIVFTLRLLRDVRRLRAHRRRAQARGGAASTLDQFQLTPEPEVGLDALGCRPGGVLVPVRDYNTLAHLDWVLGRHRTGGRDVVVLTVRLLRGPDGGAHGLERDELFTDYEQMLFTRVVAIAERHGRKVEAARRAGDQHLRRGGADGRAAAGRARSSSASPR